MSVETEVRGGMMEERRETLLKKSGKRTKLTEVQMTNKSRQIE
jgi:hypothetical protein